MLFAVVFLTIVVLFLGKLIYDVQMSKRKKQLLVEDEQPVVVPDEFLVVEVETENFS